MSAVCRGIALCICWAATTTLAAQVPNPDLEAFERYASKPTARTTWSKQMSRIDGASASATISAVAVTDISDQAVPVMRGIRIDLTAPNNNTDQVYVAENVANLLVTSLRELATHAGPFLARPNRAATSCFGSAAYRSAASQGAHVMQASQCVMADGWSGLLVNTGKGKFLFTQLTATPFLEALAGALSELANTR